MSNVIKSYDDLPLMLSASDVAKVLSISRANAYELMHSRGTGFPVLRIGRRMLVPRDKFLAWVEQQIRTDGSI